MRPSSHLAKIRYRLIVCCVVACCLMGCRPFLRTRAQLKGAEPARDLVAAPILSQIVQRNATDFSVGGVRLKDTRERVLSLWGKPAQETRTTSRWQDKDGEITLQVRWVAPRRSRFSLRGELSHMACLRAPPSTARSESPSSNDTPSCASSSKKSRRVISKKSRRVMQIELFPAVRKLLHPDNRALLSDAIRQQKQRRLLFGKDVRVAHTRLAKRFFYDKKGWAVFLFSELLPTQRKVAYVVRLYTRPLLKRRKRRKRVRKRRR